MPVVKAAGISKRYGRSWALRDVDLEVGRGERVLIMGDNGSGKSTLLRILASVSRPTKGTMTIGHAATEPDDADVRRRITFVADRPAFYGALTPYENIQFTCAMHGRSPSPLAMQAALESAGLARVVHAPSHTLSRGMTQRLALAGALLRPAELMLLDEPYTALDATAIAWVDEWLDQLREAGSTVIVATHLLTTRARVGSRVETLREGRLGEGERRRQAWHRAAQQPADAHPLVAHRPGAIGDLRRAWLVARKDLRVERRGGAAFGAMLCFAAVVMLLFGFAIGPGDTLRNASAGLGWVAGLLASVLVLDRASQLETEHGGWDAFRSAPGARWPVYAGKTIAATILLLAVEAVLLPCAVVLYDLAIPSLGASLALAAIGALAALGIVAIGMLYAVLTANLRARQLMLPLLLFPIMIPVLVAAVKATGLLLFGDPMRELAAWAKLLLAADLLYVSIGICVFGVLLDE
jgi:heme ABC exporter ATP-binding subunit CcmA/heme exporter protein CcmB